MLPLSRALIMRLIRAVRHALSKSRSWLYASVIACRALAASGDANALEKSRALRKALFPSLDSTMYECEKCPPVAELGRMTGPTTTQPFGRRLPVSCCAALGLYIDPP